MARGLTSYPWSAGTDDRDRHWHVCPECGCDWLNREWPEAKVRQCLALRTCPWCSLDAHRSHPTPAQRATACADEIRIEGEL